MKEIFTILLPAVLIIVASVIELIVQTRQLKSIKNDLEGTKMIVKDTSDLRNAILRNLEGTWSLVGSFAKFQNDCSQHHSEGVLVLTWVPGKNRYDAIYCYDVSKAGAETSLITAICQGYSDGDLEHGNSNSLLLTLKVISKTHLNKETNYAKNFVMKLSVNKTRESSRINKMTSNFENPTTMGTLTFSKIS